MVRVIVSGVLSTRGAPVKLITDGIRVGAGVPSQGNAACGGEGFAGQEKDEKGDKLGQKRAHSRKDSDYGNYSSLCAANNHLFCPATASSWPRISIFAPVTSREAQLSYRQPAAAPSYVGPLPAREENPIQIQVYADFAKEEIPGAWRKSFRHLHPTCDNRGPFALPLPFGIAVGVAVIRRSHRTASGVKSANPPGRNFDLCVPDFAKQARAAID
jgi:hypothetical protein